MVTLNSNKINYEIDIDKENDNFDIFDSMLGFTDQYDEILAALLLHEQQAPALNISP